MEKTCSIRIADNCIRCGRCVKVCPSKIFVRDEPDASGIDSAHAPVSVHRPENCILCGHCVCACPVDAVIHEAFPPERVHPVDPAALPTPEQLELLLAARRSNRVLTQRPVPEELLERIIAAADRAPTATNARQLGYTLVTDPVLLHRISVWTLSVFGRIVRRLENPLIRPVLRRIMPDVYRYVPVVKSMQRDFAEGKDRILRGATAALFIHAPAGNSFGAEDANLAYQNASLMAEALGVSQIYMGFILTALRQDKGRALHEMLDLRGRRIEAVMALGLPEFRYPKYIDRPASKVERR